MAGWTCTAGRWLAAALVAWCLVAAAPRGRADDEPAPEGEAEATTPPTVDPEAAASPMAQPARSRRTRIKLDVSGEIFAPAGREAPPVRRPIGVDARFDFVETDDVDSATGSTERCYRDAAAEVRVDDVVRTVVLPADARTVRMVVAGATPAPALATGFLTREELDLLETPFDPLLIDRLLPGRPVAVGESWSVPADDVAGLLAIDTVESGGLEAKLVDVVDGRAEVRLSGIVDGAADGVPSHVVVEGSCVADADQADGTATLRGGLTTVAVTIQERREASHVAPGFDVEARLTVARMAAEPGIDPPAAAGGEAPPAGGRSRRGPGKPGFVWRRDPVGRYDLVHDARWRPIEDGPDGLVMRFVDRGALVAQCSITALPRGSSQSPPTIAEVERDLERALAGQFGAFEHSSEAIRTDGVRVVRVVATGRADGLAFRWIHTVLTDDAGYRIAVMCTLEESFARRFAAADRELVEGLRLPDHAETEPETAAAGGEASTRQARLPQDSRMP